MVTSPTLATACFRLASLLTDPLCKAHEAYALTSVTQFMHPDSKWYLNKGRNTLLLIKAIFLTALALLTTVPGALLRCIGNQLQEKPFLSWSGPHAKELPCQRAFTMSSWNVCCMVAGFAIGENLPPWKYRIDGIVRNILLKDSDVVCLYETFDTKAAFLISERLKEAGYHFGYFNIGSRALGVSSGLMVASKYKIVDPEFTPFPKDTLLGVSKFSSKGFFTFSLASRKAPFARIITTHLQHSETAQHPTLEECGARRLEMDLIRAKALDAQSEHLATVVTGDLNLNDEEYVSLNLETSFNKGYQDPRNPFTFQGNLKQQTDPSNLDHVMAVRNNSIIDILTTVHQDDNYQCVDFPGQKLVYSDHRVLATVVELPPSRAEHSSGVDPEVEFDFGQKPKGK